jgi:radical SAM-linked protein
VTGARPVPSGPPPPPAVQRLSIRYAKRGRMRFASHRDIARAVERGVRKAGIPVAYSAGFSPHPKISYQGGAPTGAASEAEYLELALTASCEPAAVLAGLNAALPDGIDVTEVVDLAKAAEPLRLEASDWEVVLPGVALAEASEAVRVFLAADHAAVERLTNKGLRRLDARAAVVWMEADRRAADQAEAGCAILRMVVRHLTPAVRPDDILAALGHMSGLAPSAPALVTRLAQGPIDMERAAAGLSEPAAPPSRPSEAQGQEKNTCLEAGDASAASVLLAGASGQLSRGAARPGTAAGAREPDGRDRPDARDRATESRRSC